MDKRDTLDKPLWRHVELLRQVLTDIRAARFQFISRKMQFIKLSFGSSLEKEAYACHYNH